MFLEFGFRLAMQCIDVFRGNYGIYIPRVCTHVTQFCVNWVLFGINFRILQGDLEIYDINHNLISYKLFPSK